MTSLSSIPHEWHVITCEFPPQVGGVSDYTYTMASALAAGHRTHVWCPSGEGPLPDPDSARYIIHRDLGGFSPADLRRVGHALDALPAPRRLFVQWVPHGFGYRSLNVNFALWLLRRAWFCGDRLDLMVHEPFVAFALRPGQLAAAVIHRVMFTIACLGASRVWVSTPSWSAVVRPWIAGRTAVRWLPIPAPGMDAPRRSKGPDAQPRHSGEFLVGHFGTYSPLVTPLLEPALDVVLAHHDATVVLIGRDSERFRARYLERRPQIADRLRATGVLEPHELGERIAECDVMMQPYPDGISTRRTSTLAALRIGTPVVTNAGHLTEPLWREEGSVELVDVPDGQQIGHATLALLPDIARRAEIAGRGCSMYARLFDLSHSIAALTGAAAGDSRQVQVERA
jgi:glycosyltransferase involved in cell wall biosynthesis